MPCRGEIPGLGLGSPRDGLTHTLGRAEKHWWSQVWGQAGEESLIPVTAGGKTTAGETCSSEAKGTCPRQGAGRSRLVGQREHLGPSPDLQVPTWGGRHPVT